MASRSSGARGGSSAASWRRRPRPSSPRWTFRCWVRPPSSIATSTARTSAICSRPITAPRSRGAIVGTVMSNVGLEVALDKLGVPLVRTAVGDRNVLEEMERRGANLGGEQSGHVIFLDHEPTGDGLLTALKVLEVVAAAQRPLG